MSGKYWVDWEDAAHPKIRHIDSSPFPEDGMTFKECKREIYSRCDGFIDHYRDVKAEIRELRVKDIEV
jgi:hypothetical protein